MNRTGLVLALSIAVAGGLLFGLFPQLDLALARLFYNESSGQFLFLPTGGAQLLRKAAMWLAWGMAVPAMLAVLWKLIRPQQPLLLRGRAVLFLLTTIFCCAIILPNVVFKEHWGRPRPVATEEFHGPQKFMPWWDPRGANRHNGSFFSGEAATAFWVFAPAALAPAPFRGAAFLVAAIFGLTTGIFRMAFGAHYASDILAAAFSSYLVVWLIHGALYRWRSARSWTDERIEQALGRCGEKLNHSRSFWAAGGIIALITAARLVALKFSVVDLFPDESRYWAWAQAPAFGYFSKPPLIAWIIAAAGHSCGSSEFCLRAPAPLLYAGTALLCFLLARQLYSERTGFWTALSIALATGVVFSARIISTDVPLLFFWSLALLAYVKLLDQPSAGWAGLLGLALGLGLLSKYAMLYFLAGMIVAAWVDPRARALWWSPRLWLALGLAFILALPNLLWNAQHDYPTLRQTAGNAVGIGFGIRPLGLLQFAAAQFGVCGPIIFAVFVLLLLRPSCAPRAGADRILLAFALPCLALVCLVALVSSAKANWAAPALIPITTLAVAVLLRQGRRSWLILSICLGIVAQVGLFCADSMADRLSLPFLAKPDVYHRTMGWRALAQFVRQEATSSRAMTIASEQDVVVASLLYYLRDSEVKICSWPIDWRPSNQFDLDHSLTAAASEPVLYVSANCPPAGLLERAYAKVESLPAIDAPTGPHSTRHYCVFRLSGARAAIKPLKAL